MYVQSTRDKNNNHPHRRFKNFAKSWRYRVHTMFHLPEQTQLVEHCAKKRLKKNIKKNKHRAESGWVGVWGVPP